MATLDPPAKLSYNHGNNFPPNFKVIVFAFLAVSVLMLLSGALIIGLILLLLSSMAFTNQHIVTIDVDQNFIHDHNLFYGFIKIGNKSPLDKYKYITNMPLIESRNTMANLALSRSDSHSYTSVTFFGERLKGKLIVTKFDSKSEAVEVAEKLSDRLGLKFFQYDPKLVRQVLLGQKSL